MGSTPAPTNAILPASENILCSNVCIHDVSMRSSMVHYGMIPFSTATLLFYNQIRLFWNIFHIAHVMFYNV
jgi:hypothetical protein